MFKYVVFKTNAKKKFSNINEKSTHGTIFHNKYKSFGQFYSYSYVKESNECRTRAQTTAPINL